MNLISLRYFVAVAESGSISQAARSLYTSQQVVSDHIHRLETHFGARLLERTRPITLTPSGELLMETARSVLASMEQVEHRIQSTVQAASNRLVIATGRTRLPPFTVELFRLFQKEMPDAELTLVQPTSTDAVWTAPPPEADILLGDFPFDSDTDTVEFFPDPFCLVISEHLLRKVLGGGLSSEQCETPLSATQLDAVYSAVPFHLVPDQVGSLPLLPPYAKKYYNKLDMVTYLCETDQCATLFPYDFATHLFPEASQIRIIPLLDKGMCKRVGLCTSRARPQSAATRTFIRVAEKYFAARHKSNK